MTIPQQDVVRYLEDNRSELEAVWRERARQERASRAVHARTAASILALEAERLVTEDRIRQAFDDVIAVLTPG